MRKNIKRVNVVCFIIIALVGTSVTPSINATFFTKSADITQNNTAFPLENIRVTVQNDEDLITLQYLLHEFSMKDIIIGGMGYYQIRLGEESNIMIKGKPELPNICRSIIIPDDLKMDIRVISSSYDEYDGILVSPSKGYLLRCVNPEEIPYEFDEIYNENIWFPGELAELEKPYILRDFRGQVVKINPFQYNPAKERLRFYTDITVEVYPIGYDSINCISRPDLPSSIDSDYSNIYQRHFINLDRERYDPVEEQGNMLIITYDEFWDAMIPFVQWKNMKGIPTEMFCASEIGDANAINAFIENYYYDKGLTFVLLVGDSDQIPTLYAGGGASDPSFSYIVGNDHYPDLFVGRFSAQTIEQVETQVERSIEYEKEPQGDAEWYQKGTGIGSNAGAGDDGEYDWEHIRNIRSDLINYKYIEVDELYEGTHGGEDEPGDPTVNMVSSSINNGRSIINYCGLGGATGWTTSGFSKSDIDDLVNDNMLPFVICVACSNGEFDNYDACFCEAWLRATNNSEPTGAIAATGSSKTTQWFPPMDAQDECVDILVESYIDNVKHTIGGIHANGCMHMNDEYGTAGDAETDAWHIFGDPSLQIRTDTPIPITVNHSSEIPFNSERFELTVPDIEGALCAISKNYILLGYGYSDETGHTIIEFFEPLAFYGYVDLVVTGYNTIPYKSSLLVDGNNSAPEKPEKPDGPNIGSPGNPYVYSTSTIDPEDSPIYFMWDWGDENFSEWLGPYNSSDICDASHTWDEKGLYSIRVKAKDIYDCESDWSDPLRVRMPINQGVPNILLSWLLERFPNAFPMVRYIFGL